MSSFTRGSQIFLHSITMMGQGLKAIFTLNISITFIWFFYRCFQKLKLNDLYYFACERLASLKLLIGSYFYKPEQIMISVYDFKLGIIKTLPALEYKKRIWNGEIGIRGLKFWEFLTKNMLSELFYVFLSGLIFSYIFFVFKGKKNIEKTKIRGGELILPKILAKTLKQTKLASDIIIGGLPVIKNTERQHILITGTTGSGKTNLLNELIPQIRRRGDKAIIVDVSNSFASNFFDHKKNDLILNPFDKNSQNWLPWGDCREDFDFDQLASAIIGEKSSIDSFWDESAKKIIIEILKKKKHSQDLKGMLEILNIVSLKEYSEYFENSDVRSLTDREGDKTTLSIRANITNKLKPFSYLKETKNPFSIKDFINNDQNESWLFLTSSPAQREALFPLLSVWIEIAISGLMNRNPLKENKNLWIILDELPAMGRIPSLKTVLAESRKYGGCIVAGIQNIHQIFNIYGKNDALNLLDLFNSRYIFRVGDPETAKISASLLGEQEIKEIQESLSYGANTMRDGVNLNIAERRRPLVIPTEIMNLEDLECFVKLPGPYPITKLKMKYQNIKSK